MAILRSLRALARNSYSRNLFLKQPSPSLQFQSHPSILSQNSNPLFPSRTPRFLSPLSKFFVPIHGSLLLSSPPWQLSQATTPLHFQSDVIFLSPSVLNLPRTREFSAINLELESAVAPIVRNLNGEGIGCGGCGGCGGGGDAGGGGGGLVESWVNFPNLISFSRLLSGPFLGWMIVQEMYIPAFFGLAISGATDWLDGYVARKMGINSVVGSYLDPLADKVLIGCVALAMVDMGLLHPGLVGLIVARDLALVSGAVYKRASDLDWKWTSWSDFFNLDGARPRKVEPLFISKVNTAFQLLLVTAALLEPDFGTQETASYITYLSWLVALTTLASTAAYGSQYLRNRSTMLRKRV